MNLPAKAIVRPDLERDGVSIAVRNERGAILDFEQPTFDYVEADSGRDSAAKPLRLTEDTARAVYEALGRHFGGDVVNAVALRKDYDAERKRVDKMIDNLMLRSH